MSRRRFPKMSGKAGGLRQLTNFRIKGDCLGFSLNVLNWCINKGNRGSGTPTFLEYGSRDLPKNVLLKIFQKGRFPLPELQRRSPEAFLELRPQTTRVLDMPLISSSSSSSLPDS